MKDKLSTRLLIVVSLAVGIAVAGAFAVLTRSSDADLTTNNVQQQKLALSDDSGCPYAPEATANRATLEGYRAQFAVSRAAQPESCCASASQGTSASECTKPQDAATHVCPVENAATETTVVSAE